MPALPDLEAQPATASPSTHGLGETVDLESRALTGSFGLFDLLRSNDFNDVGNGTGSRFMSIVNGAMYAANHQTTA